ncbi:MAG: RsiV family protein [Prevotella sp.]
MKRTVIYTLAMAGGLSTACTGAYTTEQLTFDSIKVEKRVPLTKDADSPAYEMSINVKYVKDGSEDIRKSVNDAITAKIFNLHYVDISAAVDSFVNGNATSYKNDMLPLYEEDKRDIDKKPIYEYAADIKTRTEDGKEGVVTYFIDMYNFEGGAHGLSQLLTLNFDKTTGKTLTLEDVLVPGYKVKLNALLQKALMQEADCKDINELHDKGYLFSMEMYPSSNYVIGKDGITFIYNPYEIAPYALGRIELTVSYNDMADLMKKE